MKLLSLKPISGSTNGDTYKSVLIMVLESPIPVLAADQATAMTSQEIRKLHPIANKLTNCVGGEIAFEDGDYNEIKQRIDKWIWPNGQKGIAEFLIDLDKAESISAEDWVERQAAPHALEP